MLEDSTTYVIGAVILGGKENALAQIDNSGPQAHSPVK